MIFSNYNFTIYCTPMPKNIHICFINMLLPTIKSHFILSLNSSDIFSAYKKMHTTHQAIAGKHYINHLLNKPLKN